MKALPLIRYLGFFLAVFAVLIFLADTVWNLGFFKDPKLAIPFFIMVGTGITMAYIAQRNMPAKDALKFERPQPAKRG